MVVYNRFMAKESTTDIQKDTLPTNKILQYVESAFLLLLTLSIYASPYVASKLYDQYLHAFTMVFIVVQSYIKARNVIQKTNDIKSKSSIAKLCAFIGAFVVAMLGFKELNMETVGTSKLWSTLTLSNFSYGISDIVTNSGNVSDLITNGISALLLATGGVMLYFQKNIMGVCCMLSLLVKSMKGFCVKKFSSKNVRFDYVYPIIFCALSLCVAGFCYYKNVSLEVPKLFEFFTKNEVKN